MKRTTSEKLRIAKFVVFLVGIVFSILLATGLVFIPKQVENSVLISITLGFVLTLVLALEELKFTLQERDEEIAHNFKQVDDYLLLDDSYRALRRIEEKGDDVFHEQVREALVDFNSRLQKAELGELILDTAATCSIANRLSTTIQDSLDATMLWAENPLTGAAQDDYLNNLAAASDKRKVSVRRLFIIESGVEDTDAFKQRVCQDQACGVIVKYLPCVKWQRTEQVLSPVDFGIWDKKRVWAYKADPNSMLNHRLAVLYNSRAAVEHYQKVFDANWVHGTNPNSTSAAEDSSISSAETEPTIQN